LKELHEILMGDVEESSESSSDDDEPAEAFNLEMNDEEKGELKDSAGSPAAVGIRSGRRESMLLAQRPQEKPSKGWRKGVARESVRFQLMVDVPCWEPGCYSGESSESRSFSASYIKSDVPLLWLP
jgi:hypothetical protein